MQLPTPWWVDLFVLVPIAAWWIGRRGAPIARSKLIALAIWAIAFGLLEGTVVVYLRAIAVTLAGLPPHVADVARFSATPAEVSVNLIPADLIAIEKWREASTMVMLVAVALIGATGWRARVLAFLWAFAAWDITYYAALLAFIRWPSSPLTVDVLFLIPQPWIAQVWYPILVSATTMGAVAGRSRS